MSKPLICPSCSAPAVLVRFGTEAPTHEWRCARYPECDNAVGCHDGSTKPMGTLADLPTRRMRRNAHGVFDQVWRLEQKVRGHHNLGMAAARLNAYRWLSRQMGLSVDNCHIGLMDSENCKRVIALCEGRVADLKKRLGYLETASRSDLKKYGCGQKSSERIDP